MSALGQGSGKTGLGGWGEWNRSQWLFHPQSLSISIINAVGSQRRTFESGRKGEEEGGGRGRTELMVADISIALPWLQAEAQPAVVRRGERVVHLISQSLHDWLHRRMAADPV